MTEPPLEARNVVGRLALALCLVAVLGCACLLLVPWRLSQFATGLDPSWQIVLSHAVVNGTAFGTEVAFTQGPYAFLLFDIYHPETFALVVLLRGFLALVLLGCGWRMASKGVIGSGAAIVWTAALGCVLSINQWALGFVFLAHLVVYYFYVDDRVRSPWLILLVAAGALVALTKFTFTLLFALVMFLFACDALFRKRRAPLPAMSGVACVALFWLLAGQRVQDFGPWLVRSLEIARGYSGGMAVSGPRTEVVLFGVAAGLLCAASYYFERRRGGRWRLLPLVGQWGILFMAFKAGFVRHDAHAFNATLTVAALAITQFVLLWSSAPPRLGLIGAGAVVTSLCALNFTLSRWFDTNLADRVWANVGMIPENVRAATGWRAHADGYRQGYEQAMAAKRGEIPLPAIEGTVDIYPWEQSVVLAHGLEYHPRPVFQSYSAYTPALARLNAEHLRGAGAPRNVLFDVATIDGRFPSLADGLSWPELLARYQIRGQYGRYTWLERAADGSAPRLEPLMRLTGELGEAVTIPAHAGEPIWAVLEIRPTRLHRVRSFLFKAATVSIDVETASSAKRRFRLIPEMARAGFLLSPLVANVSTFAMLGSPDGGPYLRSRSVSKVTVSVDRDDRIYFDSEFSLALYRMQVPKRPFSREAQLAVEPVEIRDMTWSEGRGRTTGEEPQVVFSLEKPRFVHAVRLSYGIVEARDGGPRVRVSWASSADGEFASNEQNGVTLVPSGPGAYTQHAIIGGVIERVRLEPPGLLSELVLEDITLVLPSNED